MADLNKLEALKLANTKALEAYNAFSNLIIALRDTGDDLLVEMSYWRTVNEAKDVADEVRIEVLKAMRRLEG